MSSVQMTIVGLRGLEGRFAEMANTGLADIGYEKAAEAAAELEVFFAARSPKSSHPAHLDGTGKFAESFHASAQRTGHGFEMYLATSQPEIAAFIRYGHGDIYPVNASALHWLDDNGEDVFATHVGPVAPNDWEKQAIDEASPIFERMGNKIGVDVTRRLAGKL